MAGNVIRMAKTPKKDMNGYHRERREESRKGKEKSHLNSPLSSADPVFHLVVLLIIVRGHQAATWHQEGQGEADPWRKRGLCCPRVEDCIPRGVPLIMPTRSVVAMRVDLRMSPR
jgi:hypothetical protein